MAELQQALKTSRAERHRLLAAYKLSLAESASKTQQATLLQNTAAGLQDCLSKAEHQQAQLQEALSMYADYISAADERNLQLQEALAAALEEVSLSEAVLLQCTSRAVVGPTLCDTSTGYWMAGLGAPHTHAQHLQQ